MDRVFGRAVMNIDGLITLKLESEDGKIAEICFSCIRGGITWPILDYPGYYCVFGLLNGAKPGDPSSLLFLREGEKSLLEELTEAVINDAKDLRFSDIFTDQMKPEFQGMGNSFIKSIRKIRNLRDLRLRHVPFAEDFHLGRDLIRRWGKNGALKIPEDSILYKSMVNPAPEKNLPGEDPSLYPVNALRYVALAFEKIRPFGKQLGDAPRSISGWI